MYIYSNNVILDLGMKVNVSNRNNNHTGYGRCAFAGYNGTIDEIYDDGSFVIKSDTSNLVITNKNLSNGYYLIIDNKEVFIKIKKQNKYKSFLSWL